MATASSVIKVSIIGDASKLKKSIGQANAGVGGFQSNVKKAAFGIGAALGGLFAISKGFEFIGDSLNEADRLGDSMDNLNRIIGKVNTAKLREAADEFQDLGLSSQDVLELSVGFARIAKAAGLKPGLIADYADDVAAVAQALSLVDEKGRDAQQIVDIIAKAIRKPFTGKSKELGILGIKASEARVIKEALEASGKVNPDNLTDAELAAARLMIIMDKLKTVIPEALANPDLEMKQAEMNARIEELQGQLGTAIAPVLADSLQGLMDVLDNFSDMWQTTWGPNFALGKLTAEIAMDSLVASLSEDVAQIQGFFETLVADLSEDFAQIEVGINNLNATFSADFAEIEAGARWLAGQLSGILGTIGDILANINDALGAASRQIGGHGWQDLVSGGGGSNGGFINERDLQRTNNNWQGRNGGGP